MVVPNEHVFGQDIEPSFDVVPTEHGRQADNNVAPVWGLYVPSGHSFCLVAEQYHPAGHVVQELKPTTTRAERLEYGDKEYVPAGQVRQADDDVAPEVGL